MRFISSSTLLALMAAFAMSAAGSATLAATASAEKCKPTGEPTENSLCVEGKATAGEVPFTATGIGSAVFEWSGTELRCLTATGKGDLDPGALTNKKINVINMSLEYTECTYSGDHCIVKKGVHFEKLSGELNPNLEFIFFPSEEKTKFGTIDIESSGGTCLLGGKYNVQTEDRHPNVGPHSRFSSTFTPPLGEEATEHAMTTTNGGTNMEREGGGQISLGQTLALKLSGADLGKNWSIVSD
jgi:hypothetical protein